MSKHSPFIPQIWHAHPSRSQLLRGQPPQSLVRAVGLPTQSSDCGRERAPLNIQSIVHALQSSDLASSSLVQARARFNSPWVDEMADAPCFLTRSVSYSAAALARSSFSICALRSRHSTSSACRCLSIVLPRDAIVARSDLIASSCAVIVALCVSMTFSSLTIMVA